MGVLAVVLDRHRRRIHHRRHGAAVSWLPRIHHRHNVAPELTASYDLQEHGELTAFYERFVADQDDATGRAVLEAVLGEPIASFEPRWRAWTVALTGDTSLTPRRHTAG